MFKRFSISTTSSTVKLEMNSITMYDVQRITMYDVYRLCMMNKTIHGLFDLNVRNCLQFSTETRTLNSHAYKFQTRRAFSCKNALKFSFFPRTSRESNQLPAEVVLSLSLAVFKEKATTL